MYMEVLCIDLCSHMKSGMHTLQACSGELSGSYKFEYTGGEDTQDGSLSPVS